MGIVRSANLVRIPLNIYCDALHAFFFSFKKKKKKILIFYI